MLDRYQEVVVEFLAHYGNRLEIGAILDEIRPGPLAVRLSSAVTEVRPDAGQVALMFMHNLAVWRHDAYLAARFGTKYLSVLEGELQRLTRSPEPLDAVWGTRQIAFQRNG